MKQYPISQISPEAWRELNAVFWKKQLSCLPHYSFDGIVPIALETTKLGIHLICRISFLPKCREYESEILLSRPNFSSINDFVTKKLTLAEVQHSELKEDGSLYVEIT